MDSLRNMPSCSSISCQYPFPSSADKFRTDLMNVAITTLSSKILSQDKEYFAELAVDAVLRLKVYK